MELKIFTGDFEKNNIIRYFTISIHDKEIVFKLDNIDSSLEVKEWNNFVRHVNSLSLTQWKISQNPNIIGNLSVQNMVKYIDSTTSYQLFLAGIDIANYINFTELVNRNFIINSLRDWNINYLDSEDNQLLFNYLKLKLNNAKAGYDKSLCVFPFGAENVIPPDLLKELIKLTKIGKIEFYFDYYKLISFYYKPYFTPQIRNSRNKEELRDVLRKLYSYCK